VKGEGLKRVTPSPKPPPAFPSSFCPAQTLFITPPLKLTKTSSRTKADRLLCLLPNFVATSDSAVRPLSSKVTAMGLKRPLTDGGAGQEEAPRKKRKGFSVGPANLPDGTYRRKCAFGLHPLITRHSLTLHSPKDQEGPDSKSQGQEGICQSQGAGAV
jgi:hypothetical protein